MTETVDELKKISLRICILTETFYPVVGGGERQARTLAQSLIARGIDTIVITRRSSRALSPQERIDAIPVYRLPPTGYAHGKKWGLLFSSIPSLVRLRNEYDVILVSGFRVVGIAAVLVSRLLGKGCILKADSNGEMSGAFFAAGMVKVGLKPANSFFRLFLAVRNLILRWADAFIAISPDIKEELRANGVAAGKIKAIPNCVDTDVFCPVSPQERVALRHSLGLPAQDTIVIYTGRLVSYKGLPLLLRVWERLAAAQSGVTLVLVGSGSSDIHNCEAELKAYVRTHGLEDNVIFTGAVHNVESYLQASDIFVLPTEEEAFGLAAVEAMACGLPVVATRVGALQEIVGHRENGLLVAPGEFDPLYDALAELTRCREMVENFGWTARERTQVRYSVGTVKEQYVMLFQKMASRQQRVRTGSP